MIRSVLAVSFAMFVATDPLAAREGMVVETSWKEFQQQVAQRRLNNRSVRISLASGGEIKTFLRRVEERGIVVRLDGVTKQWATGKEEALVPRDAISSVRFGGRTGRGGLIGGLAGLGAGAAIAGGLAAGMGGGQCEGSACGSVLLVIPAAAVGGWLIGRATEKSAPVFFFNDRAEVDASRVGTGARP